jgi:hypothetical protein
MLATQNGTMVLFIPVKWTGNIMAADRLEDEVSVASKQIKDAKPVENCLNCENLVQHLCNLLSELESAKEIISILRDDLKHIAMGSMADLQSSKPNGDACTAAAQNHISDTWASVVRRDFSNYNKVPCDKVNVIDLPNFESPNRYAVLSTLPDNQDNLDSVLPLENIEELKSAIQTALRWPPVRSV